MEDTLTGIHRSKELWDLLNEIEDDLEITHKDFNL